MLLLLEHRDKPGDVGNPSRFLPVSTSLQGVQTLALEVRKGNGGVEETAWRTEDEAIDQKRTVCNPFVLIDFEWCFLLFLWHVIDFLISMIFSWSFDRFLVFL